TQDDDATHGWQATSAGKRARALSCAHGATMQWVGKAIGGILGLAAGGVPGSLIGIAIGHQVDQGLFKQRPRVSSGPQAISRLFFEVAFEIMGRVAKTDGRVSEEEIRVARRIMS